jgi:hypothetical protein
MDYKNAIRKVTSAVVIFGAIGLTAMTATAQDKAPAKKPVVNEKTEKTRKTSSGRDPFQKYVPVVKMGKALPTKLDAPAIQVRIDRYRSQKLAAANAHVAPPKPTSALLLNEMQVIGIFRTPRGFAAMVEATPFSPKLSYVIYPGESFFDGQLVAIEEARLVFRRDIVWSDGHREKTVETKPLRTPSPVEGMTATKAAPANPPAPESEKPAVPEKQ